jgi:hypothetical protein
VLTSGKPTGAAPLAQDPDAVAPRQSGEELRDGEEVRDKGISLILRFAEHRMEKATAEFGRSDLIRAADDRHLVDETVH